MNTFLFTTLALPGLYKVYKRNRPVIPRAPPFRPIPVDNVLVRRYKWRYFDMDHYDMSRDADKRLYIDWSRRNRNVRWWEEQYNVQYGGISGYI